jgi:D-glutamate cyclase
MSAPREALLTAIGEGADRLVTVDLLAYGVIGPLYEAARTHFGAPLCLLAARLLQERLAGEGATVALTTGLILPGHHPYGETDGPIGTAALARALALGFDARILVLTEPELVPLMASLLRQAELQVVGADAFVREDGRHRPVATVLSQTRDPDRAADEAARQLERFEVRAVVAIEKCGANRHGVYHMVGGADISAGTARAQTLFQEAARRGILTIGIGDRGNELGFGPIADTVQDLLPYGRRCTCPCGGGVADETAADLTLPATVSNWGAYGIALCLAALLDRQELLHGPELERELFRTARAAGGVDGMSGRAELSADGIGAPVHMALLTLLHEQYRALSARNPSPFSTPILGLDRTQPGPRARRQKGRPPA